MTADGLVCAALLVRNRSLGGIVLRGDGLVRDAVLTAIAAAMPVRRMPSNIDDEALIGGRDLAATLAGRSGVRRGLLAAIDGGALIVPMAERMNDAVAARIAATLDTGEVIVERDGVIDRHSARLLLILLDDGRGDDERVPDRLAERLAFRIDCGQPPLHVAADGELTQAARPMSTDAAIHALVATALAYGIDSARATGFAMATARTLANDDLTDAGVATAARLVFAHRATRLPVPPAAEPPANDPPPDVSPESDAAGPLDDQVLAAVAAALPADVLAAIDVGQPARKSASSGQGERRRSPTHGRALGARAGLPRGGARLALIDTMRTAAPWQRLRGRVDRLVVHRDDLRIKRFESRTGATTVFAVDASGSAAAARLAEAKGAVELLLAAAYVKRSEVALIAFRGAGADVLLPPTRSLTRAKRSLGDLPGGGGTPLAAGIEAAGTVATAVKAKGRTPFVVFLSDGRANVGSRAGSGVAGAQSEAQAAARAFALNDFAAVFVDISARARPEAADIAALMGARYLPLPRADANRLHAAIEAAR